LLVIVSDCAATTAKANADRTIETKRLRACYAASVRANPGEQHERAKSTHLKLGQG
jgi:hypothetical protein